MSVVARLGAFLRRLLRPPSLSKSTRIKILLGIDSAFFLLELIVGYGAHSLALVADAFHMLNDVLSLYVGLWAVKVAHQKSSSKMTYGWQRAETLGALVNGVFLVALCLSIFLEAIKRFVEPQSVSNPKLVLIVGCFGLLSNVIGLFLFHEHGHSHGGGHGAPHGGTDQLGTAEEGHSHVGRHTRSVADEAGNVADVLPQNAVAGWPKSSQPPKEASQEHTTADGQGFTRSDEDDSTAATSTSPLSLRKSHASSTHHRRRQNSGGSRKRFSSVDDIPIRPASFRNEIIAQGKLHDIESRDGSESSDIEAVDEGEQEHNERTPLLGKAKSYGSAKQTQERGHSREHENDRPNDSWHANHKHNQPKEDNGGGHSHSDLNMRGVFLHVMGDALGNIGVIGSALIIWLTTSPWRFYADPAISLVITFIILGSAIPLCKAASRILLQAVPADISIEDIKEDIEKLPGVISCHHLHVWQLSNVKPIASLHVQIAFDFEGEGSARYMKLARAIQLCLHDYGIHSSTIQPEICLDTGHRHISGSPSDDDISDSETAGKPDGGSKGESSRASSSFPSKPETCLLDCSNECDEDGQCCPPNAAETTYNGDGHAH